MSTENGNNSWKKCNTCKKNIGFGESYYVCNVTTCNTTRTGFVFCSVACWDAHVPIMKHKDSWAEERKAPRRVVAGGSGASPAASFRPAPEPLVVVTKVKSYIKERADMNTSDKIMDILSEKIRRICNDAIDKAREEGRKTVLERDFE